MTKILIFFKSIGGSSKFESFASFLSENGNDVLLINAKDLSHNTIEKKIVIFDPSVVISVNNTVPGGIFDTLDCPILIYDADSPKFAENKEIIIKNHNKSNVFFLLYQSNSLDLYKRSIGVDISSKKSIFFPPATDFNSSDEGCCDMNISFIGSSFFDKEAFLNLLVDGDNVLEVFSNIKNDYFFYDGQRNSRSLHSVSYVFRERVKYLDVISDLGLEIFSNTDWRDEFSFLYPNVAECYNPRKVLTKDGNQRIYNASKISINISHPQSPKSYSWRVPDIMASNSCLVMEDKYDWHKLYGRFISQEVKDAIIYKDRFELRDNCIKLLNDEDLRLKCVKECQYAVNEAGTWIHRSSSIEKIIGKVLINDNFQKGSIEFLRCSKPNKKPILQIENLRFIQIFLFLIYNIPILGKLIVSRSHYEKSRYKFISNFGSKKKKKSLFLIFIRVIPIIGKFIVPDRRVRKLLIKRNL